MKKLGHCTLCEKQVFEMPGERGPIGAPFEEARRVTLALIDGTQCDLTFCGECMVIPEHMPAIHRAMLEAWAAEPGPDPSAQVDNVPLGVLYEQTWREALLREASHGRTAR
jgi:hypothetical protein